MVYSTLDALRIAEAEPERAVVFFAIGFETTTPPTALAVKLAKGKGLRNFSVFCNHVLTPAAMRAILSAGVEIDGFVGPSHVSAVIGLRPYEFVAAQHGRPLVVAGFEPLDVMQAIVMLVRQLNEGRRAIENQYGRAVTPVGNVKAQAETAEVFELRESFEWRGLGPIPDSALKLRDAFADFDAERRFAIETPAAKDNPACECGAILRGAKRPHDCRLFGTVCTPETPIGSCMVSSEGACAAQWTYRRFDAAASERAAS
jgi:hydrogenase expression/formation protein HypD